MKRSEGEQPTIHFRGTPRSLDCLVGIRHQEAGPTPRLSLDDRAMTHRLQGIFAFDVGGKASRLQLSLSESTPPGNYKGSVEVGGRRRAGWPGIKCSRACGREAARRLESGHHWKRAVRDRFDLRFRAL